MRRNCEEIMEWRLTFGGLLALFLAATPTARSEPPTPVNSGGAAAPRTGSLHSVHWQRVTLGSAVGRLRSVSDTAVFVDRRIDPTERVTLSLQDATIDEIVAKLADECSLDTARFDGLIYLGPGERARELAAVAALRRRDLKQVPDDARQSLSRRRRIGWPRLTEPSGLVTDWVREQGWRIRGGERIPYDLWPAGELPALAVADQLTLLLFGFDLTYRIVPGERVIEIVPIGDLPDAARLAAAPKPVQPEPRRRQPSPDAKRVFTLRVQEQPVGAVLDALARQLQWELTVDEVAIERTGRSLDRRVSFAVESVEVDELLDALLEPAGLAFERDGKRVHVRPK